MVQADRKCREPAHSREDRPGTAGSSFEVWGGNILTRIRYVDLFAGIGGFRQALLEADLPGIHFEPAAACEIDRACLNIYERAFSTGPSEEVFISDVRDVMTADNGKGNGKYELPPFDMLLAGFPCQTFSNIGCRAGLEDPRGGLFFDIVRVLKHYTPDYFILENVQKISTIRKGLLMQMMIKELDSAGYDVCVWDLSADTYGLPQQRRRLFFCGLKTNGTPAGLISPPLGIPRDKWKYPTVWHLLEHQMDPRHLIPKKTRATVLRKNPKWMGDLQIDRPIARPVTATMAKWHRANQDNYYSETYVSEGNPDPYKSPQVDLENEPIRRITPLEGFRLQGFPDHFAELVRELRVPFTTAYRLIGNAVPVTMTARVIEHWLGGCLEFR